MPESEDLEGFFLPGPKVATTMADDNRFHVDPELSTPDASQDWGPVVEMSGVAYAKRDVEAKMFEGEEREDWRDGWPGTAIYSCPEKVDGWHYEDGEWSRHVPPDFLRETRVTDPVSGGQKGTKPQRMDLLPWDALMKVSEHYGAGAEKYEDRNWERGYAWHLTFASMMRHASAWWQGEDTDEEGLDHLNAVVFHALALRTFTLRGIGTDDRP